MELINYGWLPQQVSANKIFTAECIDLLFINKGTATVMINNYPLEPSETLPVTGNLGEITKDGIDISFNNPTGLLTQNLWIIRRFYKAND